MSQNTPVLTEEQAGRIHPVTLAFLGDAVCSLFVREKLVRSGTGKAADFQRAAAKVVSARGQSAYLETESCVPCTLVSFLAKLGI